MFRWCLAILTCSLFLGLTSCALAPAKLRRVMHGMKHHHKDGTSQKLHDLMETILAEPGKASSNEALAHFVEVWKTQGKASKAELKSDSTEAGDLVYRVHFQDSDRGGYPLDYFDEVSPADDYKIGKVKHHRRAGLGVPLVALRENREREPIERFYPPEVISRPLTAVVEPDPARSGVQTVKIHLLCPLQNQSVVCHGKRQPLAADFSVPWAALLSRSGKLNQSAILDMITRTPKRKPQLYLMEPYDPKKEPLIMIHGLVSTPLAWAGVSNELWADDTIRERYQIWHFLYNSSAPALYSARQLRTQLRELRPMLDPEGDDPAMRRTTLLTHSMGGLLGKALVVSPGDAFWKAAFKVPHQTLKLTAEDQASLVEAFEWKPDPTIHRIIFVATPHRGSAFADNAIGRIGSWITAPPTAFQSFFGRISAANPGVFTPAYEMLGSGQLDSVSSLSPRQPTLRILSGLPFAHPVKTHSIIGNRGRPGPLEKSSDGIVPYSSSHLDGAESELVVPAGHGAFHHPDAVTEIKRILKQNPGAQGRSKKK
jgi:pimeloyl-ACP methyl ester carboxylesterase